MKGRLARRLFYALSPGLRFLARRVWYLPADIISCLLGKRKDMVPPRGLIFTGSGDFLQQGRQHLFYLARYAGLQSSHRVLDVGCGIGRTAVALTGYLSPAGSYEGFDIVRQGIRWCSEHITPRFPNFRFRHASLRNELYVTSPHPASSFTFPYPDDQFDVVFAFSLFTHLLPEDAYHYFDEIHSLLKKDGVFLASFFLYEQDMISQIEQQAFGFPADRGNYRLMSERLATANLAWKKDYLLSQLEQKGLKPFLEVSGYWAGKANTGQNDFQDILVMKKMT